MKIALLVPDNRDEFREYSEIEPRFGPAPTALLEGLARIPGSEIHVISCLHRVLRSPTRIGDNIFFHGLVVSKLGWRPTAYAGCVRAIRGKLREIKPDIVHGQGTERYCALAAAFSGFPNVVTIHGNMLGMARVSRAGPGSFYWCASKLESFALQRTDGVFCNSAYTEEMVRSRTRETWRVANALRMKFFQPPPDRPNHATPVILCIGTIAPHKRQIEILEVGRRLSRSGRNFQMQFIGALTAGDPYGAQFKELAATSERAGFARHLSTKYDADILPYFNGADALVHFPKEEAFGLVVAEGLARNLKFFGARTGGVPDIADGVELSETFDPENFDALFAAVASWLDAGCPRPASAAAEMKKRYHPDSIAARHIQIYRELLEQSNPSDLT